MWAAISLTSEVASCAYLVLKGLCHSFNYMLIFAPMFCFLNETVPEVLKLSFISTYIAALNAQVWLCIGEINFKKSTLFLFHC